MTERERAFLVLQRVELFASNSSALLARESAFVREVVRGVFRWRSRLDYIISVLARRSIAKIDQRALQILRAALYELLFMDSAAHAVVNEAVNLAKKHASRARSFVNAVLRKATAVALDQMLPPEGDPERLAIALAHPSWLLEKWSRTFGAERARRIAEANQQRSNADLLVNRAKLSLSEAEAMLRRRGVPFSRSPFLDQVIRLETSSSVLREPIDAGIFHPMDEGSALVATILGEGLQAVVDLAAAPGGKSLLMSQRGHSVVSHDKSLSRLQLVRSAFARWELPDRIINGDATQPPFRRRFQGVLLDAPCSGSGTIRRNPEIKWRLDRDCLLGYAERQREMLNSALDLAENECVYSTCSLEPEENDQVVEKVLESRSDFFIAPMSDRLSSAARAWLDGNVLRLTPESGADGFTAFVLRRN